eukprot:m.49405 g.49405  ORF g.49405 m.49405 type:complete len:388 (-) comp6479_c0_seq3:461-1624(-)
MGTLRYSLGASALAFGILGLSSWLVLNGLYLEVAAFILDCPEGSTINSVLTLAAQGGNIFLVLYTLVPPDRLPSARILVLSMVVLLVLDGLAISFFWDTTFEGHYSIPLYAGAAVCGIIGCLTNVIWWQFAAEYEATMTTALSTGMGLSTLVPAVIAIFQDPGKSSEQRFSVQDFFLILTGLLTLSATAAAIICYTDALEGWLRLRVANSSAADGTSASANTSTHAGQADADTIGGSSPSSRPRTLPKIDRRPLSLQSETAPLLGQPARTRTVRDAMPRAAALFYTSSLIYGWLPSMTPYWTSRHMLVYFVTAGQIGNVLGRILSGFSLFRNMPWVRYSATFFCFCFACHPFLSIPLHGASLRTFHAKRTAALSRFFSRPGRLPRWS